MVLRPTSRMGDIMLGGLVLAVSLAARSSRLLVIHHTRCRYLCCKPDWLEQIMLGFDRPRCQNCGRRIP
jgi:hypothetical protein